MSSISKLSLFIPFVYFIFTRIKTPSSFVSWIIIYFVPILVIATIFGGNDAFLTFCLIASVYSVYEFGYIFNDSLTILKESSPTLRVSEEFSTFVRMNIYKLFILRLFQSYILGYIAVGNICLFYILPIIILYFFYNNIRSRVNLFLHFFLVLFRYSFPIYVLSGLSFFWLSIFLFPVPNLIERSTEIRFNFKFLIRLRPYIDLFRVFYYGAITVVVYIFMNDEYVYLPLYYFLYRLFCYQRLKSRTI